ncbi:MAG: FxsA family protein [Pseudomonadota bacterium]|nr:FxsA family protein [Pseudomonadota bacterium]
MPFALIPFLLLVIPVLEIAVFILVGGEIGVLATLGCVLLTAVIGSVLLRVQGFSILSRIRTETDKGRLPGRELGDGAMILVAGILLLTPGFVTDAIGFALFVPAFRTLIWRVVAARVVVTVAAGGTGPRRRGPADDDVVDLDPEDFHEAGPTDRIGGKGSGS